MEVLGGSLSNIIRGVPYPQKGGDSNSLYLLVRFLGFWFRVFCGLRTRRLREPMGYKEARRGLSGAYRGGIDLGRGSFGGCGRPSRPYQGQGSGNAS